MRILAFLLLLLSSHSFGEIRPAEGAKLNFTQIMFEYEKVPEATDYLVQVLIANDKTGKQDVVAEQHDQSTATLIGGLKFGVRYLWRYAGIVSGKQLDWNGPFKFEIAGDTSLVLSNARFEVIRNDIKNNSGGLILVGCSKMIIDREGNPVWYLPKLDKNIFIPLAKSYEIRMTASGTLLLYTSTSLTSGISLVCEIDLEGKIVWKAPNDGQVSADSSEYYHHDFKKLRSGNYMVLGCKYGWREVPSDFDLSRIRKENISTEGSVKKIKFLFNTIIEYDRSAKVVWSWNYSDHLTDDELFTKNMKTNADRRELPAMAEIFGHMNSFAADANENYIYASFRETNLVIKIDKKTGKIVQRFGGNSSETKAGKNVSFIYQHDIGLLPNGNLTVFDNNNNTIDKTTPSRAIEFSQSENGKPGNIVWSFSCKMDSLNDGKTAKFGSVDYTGNDNMLIGMGGLNRIVEVKKTTNKVVWDCIYHVREKRDPQTGNLLLSDGGNPLYRVHHTSSLYPCYFTVELLKVADKMVEELLIYNEGTDQDSYFLTVVSDGEKEEKSVALGSVGAGKSRTFDPEKLAIQLSEKGGKIKISSVSNPDFVRVLKIE